MADNTSGVEKDEQEVVVIHDVSRYKKRQNGLGISEGGPTYTLDVSGRQAIFLADDGRGGRAEERGPGIAVSQQQVTQEELQSLADRVNRAAGRTVKWIIKTGWELMDAKEQAGRGGWEKLFDAAALERPIRFSVRYARKYIAIAESEIAKMEPEQCSAFPPHIATLEALSALPADILRAALRDGRIHPEMTTQDVGGLYVGSGAELPARFTKWRATAALAAQGTPRLVTVDVLDAASKKATTVIVSGGKGWSTKAAGERLLAAVKAEYSEHGACREDRPQVSKILRQLAADNDLGTRDLALRDKYVADDTAYHIAQAHHITATISATAALVEQEPLGAGEAPAALAEH